MLALFCPNAYYDSIYDIDLNELKSKNIRGLIFDFDNTLIARGSRETPDGLHDWLQKVEQAGFRACIVSNNLQSKIGAVAQKLGIQLVAQAGKPRNKAFTQGMKVMGTTASQTAVIGDQLFTDILGGNRLGLVTILVVPVGKRELPHTRLLRYFERLILTRLQRKNMLVRNKGTDPTGEVK